MRRTVARYRLYLFGSFRVENDSDALRLSTRKHESLLAYLALFPEPHPREKIAALFWGDVTDEQARLSLRVALSTLRKELSDDILLTDRETIQLNPDAAIWVDVREFEKVGNARLGLSGVKGSEIGDSAISDLQSLISIYRGDLLPDFYDDWVALERERLRSIYLDALLRLVQDARSEGMYARALALAQRVLATDRANEKAHQHLMFCYAALGNRAAARKQYEDCVRALRDDLGVEPSAETTALCTRIQTEAAAAKIARGIVHQFADSTDQFCGQGERTKGTEGTTGNCALADFNRRGWLRQDAPRDSGGD